ncbi:MAG: hypothetical protein KUG64_10750 [Cycloclasticus sp.]|nr:hypothetical protein [Cycloclasticus sp.]
MIRNIGHKRTEVIHKLLSEVLFPRFAICGITPTVMVSLANQMRRAEASVKGVYSKSDISRHVVAQYRELWNELTDDNLDVNLYEPQHQFVIVAKKHHNVAFPPLVWRLFTDGIVDLQLPTKIKWEGEEYPDNKYIHYNKRFYVREVCGVYRVELGNVYTSKEFENRVKDIANKSDFLTIKSLKLGGSSYNYRTVYASMSQDKCKRVAEWLYKEAMKTKY